MGARSGKVFLGSLTTLLGVVGLVVGLVAGPAQAAPKNISEMLASLKVTDQPPTSPYKRSYFKHWIDADKDGCNTRAEVLIAESQTVVKRKTGTCTIISGSWLSSYDNQNITLASKVDIDHLVPLSEAWKSGAYSWSENTRTAFANDADVEYALVAVSATSNRSKGDKDPALWMPSSVVFHCNYVGSWIAQKYRWNLKVDSKEKAKLQGMVSKCGAKAEVPVPAKAKVLVGN